MKTIIAGSRNITDYKLLEDFIADIDFEITTVICGCARGVDTLGENWAKKNNIPVKRYSAYWERYGRAAGPIRNKEIAKVGEALILILKRKFVWEQ